MNWSKNKIIAISIISAIGLCAIIVPIMVIQLKSDEPIFISGSDDFLKYNFEGNGSVENPFIIENLHIQTDESTSQAGIMIRPGLYHFIIRNCVVEGYYYGVQLDHVVHSTALIVNNTFIGPNGMGEGVFCEYSRDVVIKNNTISGFHGGISIESSDNILIEENYCFLNDVGILLFATDSVTVQKNNCSFNDWGHGELQTRHSVVQNNEFIAKPQLFEPDFFSGSAALFRMCEYINFTNNTCYDFPTSGLDVLYTTHSVFSFNRITENGGLWSGSGIMFTFSHFNLFSYNLVYHNSPKGLVLDGSNNNTIHHNAFIYNAGSSEENHAHEVNSEFNIWYDILLLEGNYWHGWDYMVPYPIAGGGSTDSYPLEENPTDWDVPVW